MAVAGEPFSEDSLAPLSTSPSSSVSEEGSRASPSLSRKTLDELGHENANFDDPENYPLHSAWMLWFDKTQRHFTAQNYFDNLRKLCSIRTIKAFWCVFNNTSVDKLNERESYHLMRGEKRRPIWEDADNADGGLWMFRVKREDTVLVWQELLLAAIGEQFSDHVAEGDDVCGVSVRIRGHDNNVIQIWNQDSELVRGANVIQRLKELLPNIEIFPSYQSNRLKMQESLMKNPQPHPPRGFPQHRYGAPPISAPPMMFPPGPQPQHPFPRQPHRPAPLRGYSPHFRHPHPSSQQQQQQQQQQHFHQMAHPPPHQTYQPPRT